MHVRVNLDYFYGDKHGHYLLEKSNRNGFRIDHNLTTKWAQKKQSMVECEQTFFISSLVALGKDPYVEILTLAICTREHIPQNMKRKSLQHVP